MAWETTKPIVVPIDFSGMSVDAIRTALSMAANPTQLHVVHVVPALDQITPGHTSWSLPSDEDRRTAVKAHFHEFLKEHGFGTVQETILDGRPGTEIAEYAKRIKADLIVLPSHGYSGIKRILLGSVAEQVVRYAECPVFVLRRPDSE